MIKLKSLLIKEDLIFKNKDEFDEYNKIHKLPPNTKVTVCGKNMTAVEAETTPLPCSYIIPHWQNY